MDDEKAGQSDPVSISRRTTDKVDHSVQGVNIKGKQRIIAVSAADPDLLTDYKLILHCADIISSYNEDRTK